MDKLNKRDLIELVSKEANLSKKDAKNAVEVTFELIEKALLDGTEVTITNFGVFTPKTRVARDGTHPRKHTRITIAPKRSVSFRLSKNLKADLNK